MLPLQHEAGALLLQVPTSVRNTQDRLDSRFSFEVLDIVSTQGPLLLQLLLPRMLGAAARGEDAAQALDAQHQVLVQFCSDVALLASATRIALFPYYCLRYPRCRLFHCCSFSSSSSNYRGLTRARAGPTSQLVCLPTLVSEVVCSVTHSCAIPAKYPRVRLFQNCATQVVLAGTGQKHFKSLQRNLAKLLGFSRGFVFPTISRPTHCSSL